MLEAEFGSGTSRPTASGARVVTGAFPWEAWAYVENGARPSVKLEVTGVRRYTQAGDNAALRLQRVADEITLRCGG